MTALRHIVLVNPTIAKPRTAKFPLAILNLAAALEERYQTTLVDGNVDPQPGRTLLRSPGPGPSHDLTVCTSVQVKAVSYWTVRTS